MVAIGVAGLASSHPVHFAEHLERIGSPVEAVWDSGELRSSDYVEAFCERYGATVYQDPVKMSDNIDAAMVLTVNWDKHRELAVNFLQADIPTLIDKPVAGTLDDIKAIAEAAQETSAPLFGGSAVPYHPAFRKLPTGLSDRIFYCVGYGYGHLYYYGAHVVDLARSVAGSSWKQITPNAEPGLSVDVEFKNGTFATLRFEENSSFALLDVSDQTRVVLRGQDHIKQCFNSYIDAFVDTISSEQDTSTRYLIDSATLLLGVHTALEEGHTITPTDHHLRNVHVDGSEFLSQYELPPTADNIETG